MPQKLYAYISPMNPEMTLIAQLRDNERSAYITLYDDYYPELARYVLRNNGTRQDAEDTFQETLLVLVYKLKNKDFLLDAALKTYLFAINKNLWLKKLRNRSGTYNTEESSQVLYEEDFIYLEEKAAEEEKKTGWVNGLLENITGHCVILITRIFFKMQEPEELIRELGYKNAHTFHNQKYKCINQLRKAGKKLPAGG